MSIQFVGAFLKKALAAAKNLDDSAVVQVENGFYVSKSQNVVGYRLIGPLPDRDVFVLEKEA